MAAVELAIQEHHGKGFTLPMVGLDVIRSAERELTTVLNYWVESAVLHIKYRTLPSDRPRLTADIDAGPMNQQRLVGDWTPVSVERPDHDLV